LFDFLHDNLFQCYDYRLRLGRLNEEMRQSESGAHGDETFNDVVRDFSQLAYTHPERLHRNSNGDLPTPIDEAT
jgi:hypothetical protein